MSGQRRGGDHACDPSPAHHDGTFDGGPVQRALRTTGVHAQAAVDVVVLGAATDRTEGEPVTAARPDTAGASAAAGRGRRSPEADR